MKFEQHTEWQHIIWQGTISPRKSSELRVFEFFCENLERMTIRCPDADLQLQKND